MHLPRTTTEKMNVNYKFLTLPPIRNKERSLTEIVLEFKWQHLAGLGRLTC